MRPVSFKNASFLTALLLITAFLALPSVSYATMENYCIIPPYVKTDIKPNIMIIMDNANNMEDRAYSGYYVKTKKYEGYYKPNLMYYSSSNQWVPVSTRPAGCTAPTCVYISGNLLNWATTSKFDLLQLILVGGKGIATNCQQSQRLDGRANDWNAELTYTDSDGQGRKCIFQVQNNKLTVKDDGGGSCGYLDTSPGKPVPDDPQLSAIERNEKFAGNVYPKEQNPSKNKLLSMIFSGIAGILDFLAGEAEAAAPLRIESGSPSSGTECSSYSYAFTATGGSGSGYTWSVEGQTAGTYGCPAGQFPIAVSDTGLCLRTDGTPGSGILSGIPKTNGTFSFTIRVRDSGANTDTQSYTGTKALTISAAATLTISTASPLANGMVGIGYSSTLATNNVCSTGGYTWSITAGSLPPESGLSLSPSGVISGTPTGAQTYNFTVQVIGYAGKKATKDFQLTVDPAPTALTITTLSPLPDATRNSPYTATITATNYSGDCTWSISAGSLPTGLSINASGACSATISGTPTSAAGTYNFTIQVSSPGASGTPAAKAFSLTVLAVAVRSSGNTPTSVCLGDYTKNCESAGSPSFDTGGILQDLWTQARFGLTTFGAQAGVSSPNIDECIHVNPGSTMPSDFCTSVRNATAIDPITTLVDGEWVDVNFYANENSDSGQCQNPFNNTKECVKNFILIITQGQGADLNNNAARVYSAGYTVPAECGDSDYENLTKNTCFGSNTDLRNNPTFGASNISGKQYVSTYVVNTMGTTKSSTYNNPDEAPVTTGDILFQAAKKGGGNYYEVTDPAKLKEELEQAFQDIIKRAAAGTAASVLASGEGSGANLIQAIFYPRSPTLAKGGIFSDEISWIGRLSNYWYYVDPFFGASSIREDTEKDFKLNIRNDYTANFYFDPVAEQTKAELLEDTNADGYGDACRFGPRPGVTYSPACTNPSRVFEKINYLWEAGVELWKRSSARTIKTSIGGGLMDFSTGNDAALKPYLNLPDSDPANPLKNDLDGNGRVDIDDARVLIRYVHGEDRSNLRTRSTGVDLNGDGDTVDTVDGISEGAKVWKLGDILNSTPKIASHLQLGNYDTTNNDATYKTYLKSSNYLNKGAVFAGGNDGMLHAFKLGKLELKNSATCTLGTNDKACLTNPDEDASPLGHELWAFIPKNVLPYLKYLTDPGYCHVFTVDLTPYVFDASINKPSANCDAGADYWDCPKQTKCGSNEECTAETNTLDPDNTSWRTVLIGGMRYGGACREPGSAGTDNVKAPAAGLGYSSYFALDVTDENNPQLLWEFSNANLGFTTTGPAIVRISARDIIGETSFVNNNKNGRWFVVFGSGPTGPIDTTIQQFMGRSDQNLRLFILDLKTGELLRTIDTGIANAFAGSMLNATHNVDAPDYQDDVVYIPYVKKCDPVLDLLNPLCTSNAWNNGGVLRLLTREDLAGNDVSGSGNTALNPANWRWSTVMDGIGPVTSSVQRLQHQTQQKLRLYFGTGRYYFEKAADTDDGTTRRRLFGITEPCFINGAFSYADCATTDGTGLTRTTGDLSQVDLSVAAGVNDAEGWYIELDSCTTSAGAAVACTDASAYYRTERVITDPLTTTSGLVFFTTYKPYKDECSLGGKSHIWALKYDTGAAPGALLKGKAIVQVSTGAIEQVDLSTAFQEKTGRRSGSLEGVPPTQQGLSLISSPPAVKRVIHVRER